MRPSFGVSDFTLVQLVFCYQVSDKLKPENPIFYSLIQILRKENTCEALVNALVFIYKLHTTVHKYAFIYDQGKHIEYLFTKFYFRVLPGRVSHIQVPLVTFTQVLTHY